VRDEEAIRVDFPFAQSGLAVDLGDAIGLGRHIAGECGAAPSRMVPPRMTMSFIWFLPL